MKRADIKVGETYAVFSPSQKVAGLDAKKVTVLDTEPVWAPGYRGWTLQTVSVKNADGEAVKATDYATKASPNYSYRDAPAARSVLVVIEVPGRGPDPEPSYERDAVPLSQVRMTWSEYEDEVDAQRKETEAYYRARARKEKADQVAAADRQKRKDALNELLAGSNLVAKVLDSQVVITGPPQDLLDLAREVANA